MEMGIRRADSNTRKQVAVQYFGLLFLDWMILGDIIQSAIFHKYLKGTIMSTQKNYKKTLIACYLGFVMQAISSNFTPLLFLTFIGTYGMTLEKSH